jgi:hypothetical protein
MSLYGHLCLRLAGIGFLVQERSVVVRSAGASRLPAPQKALTLTLEI